MRLSLLTTEQALHARLNRINWWICKECIRLDAQLPQMTWIKGLFPQHKTASKEKTNEMMGFIN